MFGQTTHSDPHQEIVDKYLAENNPYEPSKPLRFNLRKYIQYAEQHNIQDPSVIPEEILDTFMLPDPPEKKAI